MISCPRWIIHLDTFLYSGLNRIKRILRRLNVIHYWCLDVSLPHFPLIFPKRFGAEATFSIRQVFAPKAGCAFLFGLGGLYFPIQTYNQAWTPTALTLEDGNSRLRTGGPGHGRTRWWCGTWVDVQQCLCFRVPKSLGWRGFKIISFMMYLWFFYDFHLCFFYGFKVWLWFFYGFWYDWEIT